MENQNKPLESIKMLFEKGILSKEEYETKVALIQEKSEKEPLLDDLEKLLKNNKIDEVEYETKKKQLLGLDCAEINSNESVDNKKETKTAVINKVVQNPKILIAVIAILLIATIALAINTGNLNNQVNSLNSEVASVKTEMNSLQSVIKNNYLDRAVFVIKGNETYYHRYGCPNTAMAGIEAYSYWVYNAEAASQKGYKKCPTCFSYAADSYINTYFK